MPIYKYANIINEATEMYVEDIYIKTAIEGK